MADGFVRGLFGRVGRVIAVISDNIVIIVIIVRNDIIDIPVRIAAIGIIAGNGSIYGII